jgi:hypothetical protein
MKEQNITLHIERLILEGIYVSYSHRILVQSAIEGELARLLGSDGLAGELQSGAALRSVAGGDMQLSSDGNPHTLGRQIAHAVYQGIGGAKK